MGDLSVRPLSAHCPCSAPVPGGGNWGSWNHWSLCSKTCDSGWQRRFRLCEGTGLEGYPCDGSGEEVRSCNEKKCPGQFFFLKKKKRGFCHFPLSSVTKERASTLHSICLEDRKRHTTWLFWSWPNTRSSGRHSSAALRCLFSSSDTLSSLTLFSCHSFPWLCFSFFLCLYSSASTEGSAAL